MISGCDTPYNHLRNTTVTKKVKFVSPFGTARYPHISKPDTVGQYADGKYKVKLVLPAGAPETQAFIKSIEDAAEEIHGAKGKKLYRPYTVDEDANEAVFTFKSQYAPSVFDAKKRPARGVNIGGGSVLRLTGTFVAFDKGISAQLNQVQIKELNGFGQCSFDEVDDGYEFDDADVTVSNVMNDSAVDQVDAGEPADALDI